VKKKRQFCRTRIKIAVHSFFEELFGSIEIYFAISAMSEPADRGNGEMEGRRAAVQVVPDALLRGQAKLA